MMQSTISRRDRRVLVAGVIIIGVLVTAARGIPAWLHWQGAARLSAMEASAALIRAQASVRSAGGTRDSLAARGKRLVALAPAFVSGQTPAAAGATLASLVSGAAATAGMRLGSAQFLTDSAGHDAFTRIRVRASVTGDVRGLTRMLLALERGPTVLAVREISITQPAPAAPATQPEALRVDLVVEGLALNRPPHPSRGAP